MNPDMIVPAGNPRYRRGEDHAYARLTWEIVDDIRLQRYRLSCRELGRKYGVSATMISNIMTNQNWKREHRPTEGDK